MMDNLIVEDQCICPRKGTEFISDEIYNPHFD